MLGKGGAAMHQEVQLRWSLARKEGSAGVVVVAAEGSSLGCVERLRHRHEIPLGLFVRRKMHRWQCSQRRLCRVFLKQATEGTPCYQIARSREGLGGSLSAAAIELLPPLPCRRSRHWHSQARDVIRAARLRSDPCTLLGELDRHRTRFQRPEKWQATG